jgi:hypothetical protein
MDGSRFDRLARALGTLRTRRVAVAVFGGALAAPLLGESTGSGKSRKRKKKCAKKCKSGCCTSKFGKCIKPVQQSSTRCGTGGSLCRNPCRCSPNVPCPDGLCCTAEGTCGACTVFVTSTKTSGDIGGLAAADARCQGLARTAGLPGTYKAWLSDTNTSVASRFTRARVPYVLPGGEVLATSWTDLTSGALRHVINQTESGAAVTGMNQGDFRVWTFTSASGASWGSDPTSACANWTSEEIAPTGILGEINSATLWTVGGFQQCPVESRLYCFQQR